MTPELALILVIAFQNERLPPEWGLAIARQESNFKPAALNMSRGDATRGGSWGLCQMSLLTARGLGYVGDAQQLTDPKTNAALAAKLCSELVFRFKTNNLADIAAGYNSGKRLKDAPVSTRTVYVPRVVKFAEEYRPVAEQILSQVKDKLTASIAPAALCSRCAGPL